MTLKKFYLRNYPTDELGAEINGESTFDGLIQILLKNDDVYEYIGVEDSLVRERLFQRLSLDSGVFLDLIYHLWTSGHPEF
tara:strand:+ start:2145 stop:2387 length:243 start_codon:yes stop_codon:yes gene_type:complete